MISVPTEAESMKVDPKISNPSVAPVVSASRSQAPIAAVSLVDEQGRIVDITADAAALLGHEPEELVGRVLSELAAPGWKAIAEDAVRRIRSGTTDALEVMLCGRSGRRTLLQMRAREVESPGIAPGTHVVAWSQQVARTNGNGSTCRNEEDLRRLAYGLLTTQEEERSRVAAQLQDGVVPVVFMAKLLIEDGVLRMKTGSPAQATEALNKALGRLRDVTHELRRISVELRPRMLDDLGLIPTIEWYCRTFCEACPARLERHLDADETRIVSNLKLEIFRIIEEALSNVAQHASARNVRVVLAHEGAELRLTIEDDGVGFDASDPPGGEALPSGVGLHSIRKRVCATKGRLILESTPGTGTKIGAVWTH